MGSYFQRLGNREKPVAWCTSVGPAELLRSFGYEVYFPENHAALIGARRLGSKYIPASGSEGYSPDICSYLTSDVGSYINKQTPLTKAFGMEGVPTPDVLVYNTMITNTVRMMSVVTLLRRKERLLDSVRSASISFRNRVSSSSVSCLMAKASN